MCYFCTKIFFDQTSALLTFHDFFIQAWLISRVVGIISSYKIRGDMEYNLHMYTESPLIRCALMG